MADPRLQADAVLADLVRANRDRPGYVEFLQALQVGIQQELARAWSARPLASPGHSLRGEGYEHRR